MEIVIILVIAAIVFAAVRFIRRTRPSPIDKDTKQALEILPETFVVLDLETTGLDPERHEIIEIGAIRIKRNSIHHDGFLSLVRPKKKVPQKITDMTGITQAMLDEKGEPLEKAIREFHEFVGDLRLVAYNAEFDMAFLQRAGREYGIEFKNDVSCVLKMARRAWPHRKSFKLKDLATDGGLDMSDQHRALADCKRAAAAYGAVVAELRRID